MSSTPKTESPAVTRVHHPYSPSTLQAREACPKYQSRQSDNAASIAGTRQHDAVDAQEDSDLLEDHQALAVAECLAYADNVAKRYPGGTVLKEIYLPVDAEQIVVGGRNGRIEVFFGTTAGYLDFAIVSKDETLAEIIDWKFGAHGVEPAENNLQGIAYMLGLKKKFPKLKTCTVQFVLPHRDEIDKHTFSLDDTSVLAHHTRIATVVRRAEEAARLPDDFSTASPTLGACLFCALIGKCPKVAEKVLKVGQKFAPLQLPENVNPTLIYDPVDAALGIKVAQIAEAWAKSFRARATEKAITDEGFIPDGYILVSSQRRTVVDARKLADIAKLCLPADKGPEVEKLFDIPIGPVEELIAISTPRGGKEAAKKSFGEKLIAEGAVELGLPYAFLKQKTTKKTKTEQT